MANLDEFLDLFKKELVNRGVTHIPNRQFMAHHLADVCVSKMNGDDFLPSSSYGGEIDNTSGTFGKNFVNSCPNENLNEMADEQETTSHKRQDGSEDELVQVCLRPDYSIVENRDCLEHIFMRMDIQTLLSVAHSSKLFHTLAVTVFKRKFGTKTIALGCSDCCEEDDRIRINGFELIFPFLRIFGAEISKLDVHYVDSDGYQDLAKSQRSHIDKMMWRIDEYINNYCANTLSSLKFVHKWKFLNDFAKPFQMIEKVCVEYTALNDAVLNFVDWFPNMQHLEIEADSLDDFFVNVTMPNMKHLVVTAYDDELLGKLRNLILFIKSNQQLQSVDLEENFYEFERVASSIPIKGLLGISTYNPGLSKLVFGSRNHSPVHGINVKAAEVDRIVKEHSQLVELEIKNDHEFNADGALTLMRQLNSLKTFRFDIQEDEYKKFIEQLASELWEYTSEHNNRYYSIDLHRK